MEITATEFKAKCLSLMEFVHGKQEEVVITKHGKPIAKLVPAKVESQKNPVGFLKGSVRFQEDIVKPLGIKSGCRFFKIR